MMTKKMSTKKTVATTLSLVMCLFIVSSSITSSFHLNCLLPVEIAQVETCGRQLELNKQFGPLHLLFEKVFSAPAASAPVERVFSSSGLLLRPHRARMSDQLLSELV